MKRSNLVEGSTTVAVCLAALAVLVLALLLGATVTQAAPPELPFSPYGIVTIDDAPVPAGTLIAAYCGGNVYRSTLTQMQAGAAWYTNLDIPGDDPITPAREGCAPARRCTSTSARGWPIRSPPGLAAAAGGLTSPGR